MKKQLQKREDELRELLQEAVRPKSKFSEDFFEQRVAHVIGEPIYVNEKLLKALGIKSEDAKNRLSVFVDWKGKYSGDASSSVMLGLLQHGRSLVEERKFSGANDYNYLEVKGPGIPQKTAQQRGETIEICAKLGIVYGLVDEKEMWDDVNSTNFLVEKKVKSPEIVAAIRLKEILLADGERVSVDELRKQGKIPQGFIPVLYWRAFAEYRRTDEVIKEDIEIFSKKKHMNTNEYMQWWVETEAENFAKIHNAGKAHTNPIRHNLTLAGEIADNHTVVNAHKEGIIYDITVMLNSVSSFSQDLSPSEKDAMRRQNLFLERYFKLREIEKGELSEFILSFESRSILENREAERLRYGELTRTVEKIYEKKFGAFPAHRE